MGTGEQITLIHNLQFSLLIRCLQQCSLLCRFAVLDIKRREKKNILDICLKTSKAFC